MKISINNIMYDSRANGPGKRTVVFTQGCNLGCPGCMNFTTHDFSEGNVTLEDLVSLLIEQDCDGFTFTGGEPLQQKAIVELLRELRSKSDKSIILFTGYYKDEVENLPVKVVLTEKLVDVIKYGRFDRSKLTVSGSKFTPSLNQELEFLTDKIKPEDMKAKTTITIGHGITKVNGTLDFVNIYKKVKA